MKPVYFRLVLFLLSLPLFFTGVYAQTLSGDDLMRDLLIVDYWNQRLNERMPVFYNHLLQGGYFAMPSARMGQEGELGVGYTWARPYVNYNLRVQLVKFLEISGDYRIFRGVDDPILTPLGFGDLSDKGVNVKFSPFTPEDSDYELPGIAIGFEDFVGTKGFYARYIALTKVFLDAHLEVTLGYGQKRIRGFFGGATWMPWLRCQNRFFKDIAFSAEYDATPYRDETIERHPKGRKQKSPFNFGVKWRLWDHVDLSLSYIRGTNVAFAASTFYNFGDTDGFLLKVDDPLPFTTTVNPQPGPTDLLVLELLNPFEEQGFSILGAWLSYDPCRQKILRLKVINHYYLDLDDVLERLHNLLRGLIPDDISKVVVVLEGDAFPLQEHHFDMQVERDYEAGEKSLYELYLLTPMKEANPPDPCTSTHIYHKDLETWNLEILPRTNTLFGSSQGKFKYSLGIGVGVNGFLFNELYYSTLFGYSVFNNFGHLKGIDHLNPSQLINVRTDIIKYYTQPGVSVDEAYLQKNWNLGKGWFARIAAGLFEIEYGGIAAEILYMPINQCWAIGVDGAYLRKRTYKGVGFTTHARRLHGHHPERVHFIPRQYFLNLYYEWPEAQVSFKIKMGRFLAKDYGARFELTRYFESGLRLYAWYTVTNGHDRINGSTYYDKGVGFSMPLDIFYTRSVRDRWGYGMAAWLRDVGAIADSGNPLYEMINEFRN